MAVTRGPNAPINEFSLDDKAAVEKMAQRAQAGLGQNYADITVAYAESDEEKRKEEERKKREAEKAAQLIAMNAALQSVIDAAKIKMQDAQTAMQTDNAYVARVQDQIDTRQQNFANQGLSVLTAKTVGLDVSKYGMQLNADGVIFRNQAGYFMNGPHGTGTVQLDAQDTEKTTRRSAETGARDGSDPTVKAEAARLNMDFVQRDFVNYNTETVTKRNYNEAAQTVQQATEAQQHLNANPDDADAQRAAEEVIKSSETTTQTTTEALSAPAPAPNETQALYDANKAALVAGTLEGKPLKEIAAELGIPEGELAKLEEKLLADPEVERAVLRDLEFNSDDAALAGMSVAGVENARTGPAASQLSDNVQEVIRKANADMKAPALEQQQPAPTAFRPSMGA